jgi:purine-binding chemotaxis protein CheW
MTTGDSPVGAIPTSGRGSSQVAATGSERYLSFALRGESFALPILDVTEIMEFHSLTTVPMMPSFIRGVINLRGRVVPVVDISARFGREPTEVGRRTSIIIVNTGGRTGDDEGGGVGGSIGILVDGVNKVMHLNIGDIEPPPTFGNGIRTDYISGLAKYDGEFVIVLDVSHAVAPDEWAVTERPLAPLGVGATA